MVRINLGNHCTAQHCAPQIKGRRTVVILGHAQSIAVIVLRQSVTATLRQRLLIAGVVGVEVSVRGHVSRRVIAKSIALVLVRRVRVRNIGIVTIRCTSLHFTAPAKPPRHVPLLVIVGIWPVREAPPLSVNSEPRPRFGPRSRDYQCRYRMQISWLFLLPPSF